MAEICVICPSRNRPENIPKLYRSMLETSDNTKLIVRADLDQASIYSPHMEESDRFEFRFGKPVGPAASINEVGHFHREPLRIYGVVPDDCHFMTKGWDNYLLEQFDKFPGRIGMIAAAHNGGDYVNFPWVSREWINVVGWIFHPGNFHHACDTILEILGECSQSIVYAPRERFEMHHDLQPTFNRDQFDKDLWGFLQWCVGERRSLVERVRKAKDGATKSIGAMEN